MTNHICLQAFVEVPSSSVLFVEGGLGSRHQAREPISVAAARVVVALARARETNPSLYALAYFCSEHSNWRQPLGTALDLIITLLLQLINQHRHFDATLLHDCRDMVLDRPLEPSADDVRSFCDRLRHCVLALPKEVALFCIIEGTAYFEGPRKRTEHTLLILEWMLELGKETEEGRAWVKCLFTTPAKSPQFIGLFEPYDVHTIQSVNSTGVFRKKSWFIGREL